MYGAEEPETKQLSSFRRMEKLVKTCASVADAVSQAGALDLSGLGGQAPAGCVCRQLELWGRECDEFSFDAYPGVHVLCGALSRKQQVELAYNSLADSLAPPNTTNLHAHWDAAKRHELDAIWSTDGPLLDKADTLPTSCTLSHVRWATLGFQYNWTERSYSRDNFVPFTPRLAEMAATLARSCSSRFSITAEAGIVNFYPDNQVMGGHRDDGEEALMHPVVSISLGSPCCFLLGGLDKSEEPTALVLRSGDVLVLGGEGRLRFHGVPRVWVKSEGPPADLHPSSAALDAVHCSSCPLFLEPGQLGSGSGSVGGGGCMCDCPPPAIEVQRALKLLAIARINVNLRQCFKEGGAGAGAGEMAMTGAA